MATKLKQLREQVQQRVREKNIPAENIVNLDETSMSIFNLMVTTLERSNRRRVPGNYGDKFALSIVTVWRASGSVDFCVVWHSKRKNEEAHKGKRWENIDGIWWYRSPYSKYTTKQNLYGSSHAWGTSSSSTTIALLTTISVLTCSWPR